MLSFSRLRQRRGELFPHQTALATEHYDYGYRLPHSLDATMTKLSDQRSQQFATSGMPVSASTTLHAAAASSPYERDSFNSSENDYYKAWQTQKRVAAAAGYPHTSHADSTMIGCSSDHVIDHIYESPNFARKDFKTFNKS